MKRRKYLSKSISKVLLMFVLGVSLSACIKKPLSPSGEGGIGSNYLVHTVKYSGETLSIIAGWYTGSTNNWKQILDHNPGLDVKRIQLGQNIRIPRQLIKKEAPLPKSALGGGAKIVEVEKEVLVKEPDSKANENKEKKKSKKTSTPTREEKPEPLLEAVPTSVPVESPTQAPTLVPEQTPEQKIINLPPLVEEKKEISTKPVEKEEKEETMIPVVPPAPTLAPEKHELKIRTRDELLKELLEE